MTYNSFEKEKVYIIFYNSFCCLPKAQDKIKIMEKERTDYQT